MVRLPVATADTARLNRAAMQALGTISRTGHHYKKAGVMLLELGLHGPSKPSRIGGRGSPTARSRGALPSSPAIANGAGRRALATEAKAAIGRGPARTVRPGQVVLLNMGTTIVQLARQPTPTR